MTILLASPKPLPGLNGGGLCGYKKYWGTLVANSEGKSAEALVEESLQSFQHILKLRGDFSLRVAKRVTFLTRFVVLLFGAMTLFLFLMIYLMSERVNDLSVAIDTMNQHFATMTQDMAVINTAITHMDQDVASMPTMYKNLEGMRGSVGDMKLRIASMQNTMQSISGNMTAMNNNMQVMDSSFVQMDRLVANMRWDVNRLSAPARTFNWMNPFN